VTGPDQLFVLPPDRALEVDPPRGSVRVEGERAEGDLDFECPALVVPAGVRVPDPVPRPLVPSRGELERVGHEAGRIHLEEVSGLLVQERVHGPHEPVVRRQELVPLHRVAEEAIRLRIVRHYAHVKAFLGEHDADLGALRGRAPVHGILLDEVGGRHSAPPGGFVEEPVDLDLLALEHPLRGHGLPARRQPRVGGGGPRGIDGGSSLDRGLGRQRSACARQEDEKERGRDGSAYVLRHVKVPKSAWMVTRRPDARDPSTNVCGTGGFVGGLYEILTGERQYTIA